MDQICITNLRFFARHGVFDFEREKGQYFVLSARLETDTRAAGMSDRLQESTSYAEVAEFLVDFLTQNTYQLLEAAAEQACRALLLRFPRIWGVELELKKPDAPIDLEFESVSVRIRRGWHTAYVALGSNLGDKEGYLRSALAGLEGDACVRLKRVSTLIATAPYGGVEQDDFLNGVCRLETLYTPEELLQVLHRLEGQAGRERKVRWGPRTLDLDILLYDNIIMYTKELTIPHADMHRRDFVLRPMAEIAPYVEHPVFHKSMLQLWQELEGTWS